MCFSHSSVGKLGVTKLLPGVYRMWLPGRRVRGLSSEAQISLSIMMYIGHLPALAVNQKK
jgi:hypothetical protein